MSQAQDVWNRYRWWTIGLLVLLALLWALKLFFGGIGEAIKELGKRAGNWVFLTLGGIAPRSGVANYLKWLPKTYGTIKPLGIASETVKLDVARVHVPLRVTAQTAVEQHQKELFGDPRGAIAGPDRVGRERGETRVFTLLSEAKLLPRPGTSILRARLTPSWSG